MRHRCCRVRRFNFDAGGISFVQGCRNHLFTLRHNPRDLQLVRAVLTDLQFVVCDLYRILLNDGARRPLQSVRASHPQQ